MDWYGTKVFGTPDAEKFFLINKWLAEKVEEDPEQWAFVTKSLWGAYLAWADEYDEFETSKTYEIPMTEIGLTKITMPSSVIGVGYFFKSPEMVTLFHFCPHLTES
ncbi:MAG: hypothetical protein WC284_17410 [Candidimonas sp.]